jgi:hypothetical protein
VVEVGDPRRLCHRGFAKLLPLVHVDGESNNVPARSPEPQRLFHACGYEAQPSGNQRHSTADAFLEAARSTRLNSLVASRETNDSEEQENDDDFK